MKSQATGRHQWLRDAMALRLPDYFLYIGGDRLYFLKLVGKSVVTVAHQRFSDLDSATVNRFLSKLRETGFYYGQPISLLLEDSLSFSYIRRLRQESPADLLKRIQNTNTENFHVTTGVVHLDDVRLFISHGIINSVYRMLCDVLSKQKVSFLTISNFGLYLFLHSGTSVRAATADRFRWIDDTSILAVSDILGNVLIRQIETDGKTSIEDVGKQARQWLPTLPEHIAVLDHAVADDGKPRPEASRPVAAILRTAILKPKLTARLANRTRDSQRKVTERIVSNSLGLLAKTLASVAILLILLLSGFRLSSNSVDAKGNGFQMEYSEVLALQLRQDSLTENYRNWTASKDARTNFSALLSMFCLKNYAGLQLDEITIKSDKDGQIILSANGLSRSEARVFHLENSLNERAGGVKVKVDNLEPVLSRQRQSVDTLYRFTLNLERSE